MTNAQIIQALATFYMRMTFNHTAQSKPLLRTGDIVAFITAYHKTVAMLDLEQMLEDSDVTNLSATNHELQQDLCGIVRKMQYPKITFCSAYALSSR